MEIEDNIRVDTALKLIGGEKPMATCPHDDEPLIMTLEFKGAEFICMVCERKFGFLSPKPATWTQELQDRYEVLKAQYDAERAERKRVDG